MPASNNMDAANNRLLNLIKDFSDDTRANLTIQKATTFNFEVLIILLDILKNLTTLVYIRILYYRKKHIN